MYARIREARRCTDKSQEDFAALLKVSRGAVGQWEMEQGTTPSVKNLAEIAKLSGLSFEWLATGRGEKKYGEPMVREPEVAPYYAHALHDDERAVLLAMDRMKPAQRTAFVAYVTFDKGK